jgi:hypothetical protein
MTKLAAATEHSRRKMDKNTIGTTEDTEPNRNKIDQSSRKKRRKEPTKKRRRIQEEEPENKNENFPNIAYLYMKERRQKKAKKFRTNAKN